MLTLKQHLLSTVSEYAMRTRSPEKPREAWLRDNSALHKSGVQLGAVQEAPPKPTKRTQRR